MSLRRQIVSALLLLLLVDGALSAQEEKKKKKRKKKEAPEITQVLEVLKDPPSAVSADPQRLNFLTAPMSSKGLLSQQTRDCLKTLRSLAKGAAIIKIRAFVAGTGDLRRVQAIVSDQFTEWKLAIPALTTIQVGQLPQEGAQIWLEAITVEKKAVNPQGLAFFSGQQVTSKDPLEKVEPLLKQSVAHLNTAIKGAGIANSDVLRVTCFSSALGDYMQQRQHLAEQFPRAAQTIVQVLRGLSTGLVECEAVARAATAPSGPMQPLNPAGLEPSPNYSQLVIVNAPKIIFSGSQMAFHNQDADIRLAFDRLKKALEQNGASIRNVVMTNYYPLAPSTIDKIRKLRFDYLDKTKPPAATMLVFEGLPSMDASFAVEVVALP